MEEKRLKAKLEEYQVFVIRNVYTTDTSVLKAFLKRMVEDKITSKAIEILEYIKEHKGDNIKSLAMGRRFGIFERGSEFYKYTDSVIDDILEDMADKAEQNNNSPVTDMCQGVQSDSDTPEFGGVDSKEDSKQPQQLKQPQENTETKKRGRSVGSFLDCILVENKEGLLNKLRSRLQGKKGEDVSLVIGVLISCGVLTKPSHTQTKNEFGDIGNSAGYYRYLPTNMHTKDEVEGVKKFFVDFIK